jgi:hypothetical protein
MHVFQIYSFAFLLFMIFFLWSVLLVCFKCMGDERAGCAAGGNVLDIKEIRGDPNLKPKARKIIQRSWKVQSAFFIVAFLIPIASGLFLVKGLKAVNEALVQIQGISDVSTCHEAWEWTCIANQSPSAVLFLTRKLPSQRISNLLRCKLHF